MNNLQLIRVGVLSALLSCTCMGNTSAAPMSGTAGTDATAAAEPSVTSLIFDRTNYTDEVLSLNGTPVAFRAYRNIPYVSSPKDAAHQSMSIFIPAAYLTGGTVNGYTAATAPIFMPNGVGGYMPGEIEEPQEKSRMSGAPNAALTALSRGLVVAAPAIRGRTNTDAQGVYVGKAPALIVDYKAAVRYLRYNAARLPAGNTERIISNGTSAGGALSALLGATGNSPDYTAALAEIGAAGARDDIFAASCYCPITNLEHADMAYEWIFSGINDYHQGAPAPALHTENQEGATVTNRPANAPTETSSAVPMTAEQITASARLKKDFPRYLNSLRLKDTAGSVLQLYSDGTGTFAEYIKGLYRTSAQYAVDNNAALDGADWFTVQNGRVTDVDLAAYARWATRLKATPAFDKFDLSSGENDEFGTETNVPRHFTKFSRKYDTTHGALAPAANIRMLNPLNYIGTNGVRTAPHFRIRHGAKDRDTALPIPAVLALRLMNAGIDVDFAVPWGYGHAGDYDLDELFTWIDRICK